MEKLRHLFQPLKIGSMEMKNRIVMPGMDPSFGIDDEGRVTEQLAAYLVERARSEPGMIVSGAMAVHPTGIADPATVHMLLVSDEGMLPGLENLVKAVHRYDVKFGAQLTHCGLAHLPRPGSLSSDVPVEMNAIGSYAEQRRKRNLKELVQSFGAGG